MKLLNNSIKLALVAMMAFGSLASVNHAFGADAEKMEKHVKKEQKNIKLEDAQHAKAMKAENKLTTDKMEHRNHFVIAKDKMVAKYHKKRVKHETKRGAKLVKDIKKGE